MKLSQTEQHWLRRGGWCPSKVFVALLTKGLIDCEFQATTAGAKLIEELRNE